MAISADLRERVIESYNDGEGSIRELAERYKVGTNTIVRWLRQIRHVGHCEPGHHRSGPSFSLAAPQRRAALLDIVTDTPDATLAEMAQRFLDSTGHPISSSGVRTELIKMGFTRKKKPFEQPSETASAINVSCASSKKRSHMWIRTISSSSMNQDST